LREYEITHIIGLSQSISPRFPDDFVYLSIQDVEDSTSANISRYFRPTTAFIENVKKQKGKVLVHCWQGVSRSVSIIIAYLMKADKIKYKRALQLVRETRPQADPNPHFVKELKNYEKMLFRE
jgi:protein-tyrosine phosphatase